MKRFRFASAVMALLALPALGFSPRLAAQDEDVTAKLYKEVVDTAVFIVTPMKGGMGMGSGSLIDKQKRYVLTNFHVVDEAEKVYVQFPVHLTGGDILKDKKKYIDRIPAGQAFKGTVLYRDKTRDLALVQLDSLPPTAKQVKLAKTSPETGSGTWNIGSPGAVSGVFGMTSGIVRTVNVENTEIGGGADVIHLKARMVTATNPTNPGDSGGPLFNRKGEQVAVTESGMNGVQQVNMFVDITEVRAFLKEKKIVLSEEDAPVEPKTKPKVGLDSTKTKSAIDPTAPGTGSPATGNAPPTTPGTAPTTGGAPPATGGASDADEKAAAQALSRAKIFADGEDNRPTYVAKLKDVIAKYPDTSAAKEAKKLLDKVAK